MYRSWTHTYIYTHTRAVSQGSVTLVYEKKGRRKNTRVRLKESTKRMTVIEIRQNGIYVDQITSVL